jgi:hypothetical protein
MYTVDRKDNKPGRVRKRYIYRQLFFMGKCLTHLHHAKQTWTALWDPDEYLVFRKGMGSSKLPAVVPSTSQPNVFVDFVKESMDPNTRCITIPRVLMGAEREEALTTKELADSESVVDDPQRLTTFRWHFHTDEKDSQINGLTKVMVDASSLAELMPLTIRNPHRPLLEICGSPHFRDNQDSPFRLNHYLGSWEEYSYRDDARTGKERSKEAWLFLAKSCGKRDESDLTDWLGGFVKSVGQGKAHSVLQDAGLPSNFTQQDRNETEWTVDRNSKMYEQRGKAYWRQFEDGGSAQKQSEEEQQR